MAYGLTQETDRLMDDRPLKRTAARRQARLSPKATRGCSSILRIVRTTTLQSTLTSEWFEAVLWRNAYAMDLRDHKGPGIMLSCKRREKYSR